MSAVCSHSWRAVPNMRQACWHLRAALFPLSLLIMLRAVATRFSSDVKIPLLDTLSIQKQKRQKKRKESRWRRMRTRNAALSVTNLTALFVFQGFLRRNSRFWGTISERLSCRFQKWSSTNFLMSFGYLVLQLDTRWVFQSCLASCHLGCPWLIFSPFVSHFRLISDSLLQRSHVRAPGEAPLVWPQLDQCVWPHHSGSFLS